MGKWDINSRPSSNFPSPFPAVDHQHALMEWVRSTDPSSGPPITTPSGTMSPVYVSGFLPGVRQTGPTRIPGPPTTDSLGNQPPRREPLGRLKGAYGWILSSSLSSGRYFHRAVYLGTRNYEKTRSGTHPLSRNCVHVARLFSVSRVTLPLGTGWLL